MFLWARRASSYANSVSSSNFTRTLFTSSSVRILIDEMAILERLLRNESYFPKPGSSSLPGPPLVSSLAAFSIRPSMLMLADAFDALLSALSFYLSICVMPVGKKIFLNCSNTVLTFYLLSSKCSLILASSIALQSRLLPVSSFLKCSLNLRSKFWLAFCWNTLLSSLMQYSCAFFSLLNKKS